MYTVIVIGLPEVAIWLTIGMVVEAIAIGILACLVLRTVNETSVVKLIQQNHEHDIDALWTIHEGTLEHTQPKESQTNE